MRSVLRRGQPRARGRSLRTWILSSAALLSVVGCDSVFNVDHVGDYVPVCRFGGVATGRSHSCSIDGAGHVWCWGANDSGQVDDSPDLHALAPRQIPLTGEAAQISAGGAFTCARMVEGTVFCWGANEVGQLGTGPGGVAARAGIKQVNLVGDTAIEIGAGEDYACAVRASDQAVTCWGSNLSNTLGRVDGALRAGMPEVVPNTTGTKRIGIGHRHNCLVGADDVVRCWGRGDNFETGATGTTSLLNVVQGLEPASSVAAGGHSSCAVELNGTVRCWGNDDDAQLGDNMLIQTMTASAPALFDAVDVQVGENGACARRLDGILSCWGLADPGNPEHELALKSVTATEVGPVDRLSYHYNHTCAVAHDVVRCWGANDEGQLGRGTIATTPTPTAVGGLAGATQLTVGGAHACALAGATLSCWGANDHGEIGNDTLRTAFSRTPITTTQLASVMGIASADQRTCAWSSAKILCWGNAQSGAIGNGAMTRHVPAPALVSGTFTNLLKVAMGPFHSCAIDAGTLQCWGDNDHGKLGIGSTTDTPVPSTVLLASVTDAAAGAGHTCAIASGGLHCWGDNARGQLGYGGGSLSSPGPVLSLPTNPTQVVAGAAHTCALLTSGDVYCWGANDKGQLGLGTRLMAPTPMKVPLAGVARITASSEGTCAQVSTKVVCWGASARSQLGNGAAADALSPVEISELAGSVSVARSSMGGCAITATNTVQCWGANLLLGNGAAAASPSIPMDVPLSCR